MFAFAKKINALDKLKFESKFQKLSPGGAISYVEIPNMENNVEAAEAIVEYIYDNIMYAELNSKSDYCQCCGYPEKSRLSKTMASWFGNARTVATATSTR